MTQQDNNNNPPNEPNQLSEQELLALKKEAIRKMQEKLRLIRKP